MKTNKLVIGLLGLVIFAGCTGFNQDPFKAKDDAIRNATPPDSKIGTAKPISNDILSLNVPDIIIFKIGQQSRLDLKVNSFLSGYTYTYAVANIDDFKNAVVDNGAKQFIWTPDVSSLDAGQDYKSYEMTVTITADPVNPNAKMVPLKSTQTILVYVQGDRKQLPKVKTIKMVSPLLVEEGSSINMTVVVEDLQGANTPGMMPTLNFKGKFEPYAAVKNTRYLAATKEWEIDVLVDLGSAEITRGKDNAPLNIQAVDRFGTISIAYPLNFIVLTKLGLPMTTFLNTTTLKAGVANTIPFQIFDSNNESILTLLNTLSLPAGAFVSCESSTRVFQQCTLSWTPAVTDISKNFVITLEIQTRSSNPTDARTVKNNLPMSFNVVTP